MSKRSLPIWPKLAIFDIEYDWKVYLIIGFMNCILMWDFKEQKLSGIPNFWMFLYYILDIYYSELDFLLICITKGLSHCKDLMSLLLRMIDQL